MFTEEVNKYWRAALCGSQTWIVNKRDRQRKEALETWCWRRTMKKCWTDKLENKEVLRRMDEGRAIWKIIPAERRNMRAI